MAGAVIDDAEEALRLIERALRTLGYSSRGTSDAKTFTEIVSSEWVDFTIVDYKLPDAARTTALRDGPAIVAWAAAHGVNRPAIMLTGWKDDCDTRMQEFDPRLEYLIVEKPTRSIEDAWVESLRPALEKLMATGDANSNRADTLGFDVGRMEARLFHLSDAALRELDQTERDTLEAEALLELDDQLQDIWDACDSDWIKLQRVGDVCMITDRGSNTRIPNEDDVVEGENRHGYGAMVIGRPILVEEFGGGRGHTCSPASRDWERYPYVELGFGDRDLEVHLDTGNPTSFIAADVLAAAGMLQTGKRLQPTTIRDAQGRKMVRRFQPAKASVFADGPEGNVELVVVLGAIQDWRAADNFLNAACATGSCPGSDGTQCGRRLGLMGRDLLYALERGKWRFDPTTGRFEPVAEAGRRRH